MREPQAEPDAHQPGAGGQADPLGEEQRAERRRRERAQREKDRDLRRRRVAERPQPEEVADAAGQADEHDGGPAAAGEARPAGEEAPPAASTARNPTEASMAKALTGTVGYFRT